MAEDKKSLAISLVLQDTQRTLEEKEIAETVDNVVRALGEELNASLRIDLWRLPKPTLQSTCSPSSG